MTSRTRFLTTLAIFAGFAPDPSRASKPTKATASADPDFAAARRHLRQAIALYDQRDYAGALRELEIAKRVYTTPADIEYNIAKCNEQLENWTAAADAYDRFLAAEKSPDKESAAIRERVATLRARGDTKTRSTAATATSPAIIQSAAQTLRPPAAVAPVATVLPQTDLPAHPRKRLATWIVAGGSAAILAGALAAELVAVDRREKLAAHCTPDGLCDASLITNAQQWIDSERDATRAAYILLGAGVAAVGASLALFFVERRGAWQIAPTASASGGGIIFSVSR